MLILTVSSEFAALGSCGELNFSTIQEAADCACAGDTIVVKEGCYREWVRPPRGGESVDLPIRYQAHPGHRVVIKGSEVLSGWQDVSPLHWVCRVPEQPGISTLAFREKLGGDWWHGHKDHPNTRGMLFADNHRIREVQDKAEASRFFEQGTDKAWWVEVADETVVFHLMLKEGKPADFLIEAALRPACFFPYQTGINHIVVEGFEMCQCASPWAPPTGPQMAVLGPHWSKGWVIQNNHIHSSRCCGISLGKDVSTGDNEWARLKTKHGSQREREVVFRALKKGWNRDCVGSHMVKDNHIHHCGQAGIVGHMGAIFSEISGNHIHHIHLPDETFSGHEMAGIKLHAPIDTRLEHNHLHDNIRGIWLDWQTQGTRVTRNLFHDNRDFDLYIEVSHGPFVVDHNIFLSAKALKDCSSGGAFLYNWIKGTVAAWPIPNRFTPYHFPQSTDIMGIMTILGGDNRFYFNVFEMPDDQEVSTFGGLDENADLTQHRNGLPGLLVYRACPHLEKPWENARNVDQYAALQLPVWADFNLYAAPLVPLDRESASLSCAGIRSVEERTPSGELRSVSLIIPEGVEMPVIQGTIDDLLGLAFQTESGFTEPGGGPLGVDCDFAGEKRCEAAYPGPFSNNLTHHCLSGVELIAKHFPSG